MFKSPELNKLYQKGHLKEILDKYSKYINESNLLGRGGDASVFNYQRDLVLKVVHKEISFFRNFSQNNKSAKEFALTINKLNPYFLSVDEVLYENVEIMIYTQKKCQVLTKATVTKAYLLEIYQAIRFMFANKAIASDLAPHNWGIIDGHVVVIDYHGLKNIQMDGDLIREAGWWNRIARNMVKYLTLVMEPKVKKRKEIFQQLEVFNKKSLKYLRKKTRLPKELISLLQYFYHNENKNISLSKTLELLDGCILFIKNTFLEKTNKITKLKY